MSGLSKNYENEQHHRGRVEMTTFVSDIPKAPEICDKCGDVKKDCECENEQS